MIAYLKQIYCVKAEASKECMLHTISYELWYTIAEMFWSMKL